MTELNRKFLSTMPNSWSKQAYVQGFDYESITFKKSVNMFEQMEIAESIYEGVSEPSYKKTTRTDTTRASHSRQKRGESASSHTYYEMSESTDKRRKRYIDYPEGKSKPICLIHGPSQTTI